MENKKDYKILIIIFLLVCIIGFITYIVLDKKVLTNKSNTNITTTSTTTKASNEKIDSETIASNLEKYFSSFGTCDPSPDFSKKQKEYTIEDIIKNDEDDYIISNYLINNKIIDIESINEKRETFNFSIEDVKEAILKLFGKNALSDYKIKKAFKIGSGYAELNDEETEYTAEHEVFAYGCEDGPQKYIYNKEINEKYIYMDYINYYYELNNEPVYLSTKGDDFENICTESEFEKDPSKYIDKFNKYRISFKYDGENYIFEKIISLN